MHKGIASKPLKTEIYLYQLCVSVAAQTLQPLLASYKARKYAQVNHLVRVKPFSVGYKDHKTSPHTFYSDAAI